MVSTVRPANAPLASWRGVMISTVSSLLLYSNKAWVIVHPWTFAVQVISAVGNYGEIYDRNLGPGTPFELERGPNALWTDGGLLYAPPYR